MRRGRGGWRLSGRRQGGGRLWGVVFTSEWLVLKVVDKKHWGGGCLMYLLLLERRCSVSYAAWLGGRWPGGCV